MDEENTKQPQDSEENSTRSVNRRAFLKGAVSVATAVGAFGTGAFQGPLRAQDDSQSDGTDAIIGPQTPRRRARTAFDIKNDAAEFQFDKPIPNHPNNGDEARFPSLVGNYHKGLPTINNFGEVDLVAYGSLIHALTTGEFSDFEAIPLGGTAKLVNPEAGLAYPYAVVERQIYLGWQRR